MDNLNIVSSARDGESKAIWTFAKGDFNSFL